MPLAVSGISIGLGGLLYVILLVTLGIMAIRKGHWIMFIIGIVIPIFWLIGALMPPAARD
jgi:hypothetical protein